MSDASGMTHLNPVKAWVSPANGIWKAEIADMSGELRYTDLAAEAGRIEAINTRSEPAFPFADETIGWQHPSAGELMVRIPTGADESIYGFGLQLDGLNKSRKVLTLNADHWGTGSGRTHAPVPFYVSSRGYGVFFNTARFLKVYSQVGNRKDSPNNPAPVDRNPPPGVKSAGEWQALPRGDSVEVLAHARGLEVIVIGGDSLLDVVSRYNLFCGGGALPPLWGLGFWHRAHAHATADEVESEVAQYREHRVPLDVVGLEPGWMTHSYPCTYEWQKMRFPDPSAFSRRLLDAGVRLNLWVNPYISPRSRMYEGMYPYAGSHMVWLGIVPDYTIREARRLLIDQHTEDHFNIGISGYKVDEVDGYDFWLWPDHATFPSGTPGQTMRQSYGLLMQHLLYRDLFKANDRRTYGNVRSSNGGASGYPFVIYSDSYNHAEYITGLAAASLCGILWTPEVRSANSAREWLNRLQTVCFSPMAMLNAWADGTRPWDFPDVADAVREVIQLRMRLLPYLYSAFAAYHFDGVPPIRAMILEGGDGQEAIAKGHLDGISDPYAMDTMVETNDQFMFGPSIMVAPFYGKNAVERPVRLPAGRWYDFYTGALAGSQTTITVTSEALRDRIPLFVRDGGVVPMLAKDVLNSGEAYGMDLEVRSYGHADGRFALYEDDGKTFAYDRGGYRIRQLVVESGRLTEVVTKDDSPAMFGEATLSNHAPWQ